MQPSNRLLYITRVGMVAGLYTALTLCLAPIGFGPVQCRVAEALTVLAAYTPAALPGLVVGCFLTNLAGLSMGANAAGGLDLLLGPLATGLAAWLSYGLRRRRVRGVPLASTLPPVAVNALVVGTELTLIAPVFTWRMWLTQTALVAAGQLIACVGGGTALAAALNATGLDRGLLGKGKDTR